MVAVNPLFGTGHWTIKKFNSTVITDIWPGVLFFTAVAAVVSAVTMEGIKDLSANSSLLTVLGTVLGLVISFRTSSAYERYQDGRKMWTNINTASRNFGQLIWVHVPLGREATSLNRKLTDLESIIEKKTIINLLQAFPVAVKHFLRGEQGIYYEDLYPLVCYLPKYANGEENPIDRLPLWRTRHDPTESDDEDEDRKEKGRDRGESTSSKPAHQPASNSSLEKRKGEFQPQAALPNVKSDIPLMPARSPPKTTVYDLIPMLKFFPWILNVFLRSFRPKEERPKKRPVEGNIPLEITLFLANYTGFVMKSGLIPPAIALSLQNNLGILQDTFSNLERICKTPLPFAYQAHLRMTLWFYLFFLPFQVVKPMGYITIPGTAFTAFLLLGFLEIGQEIENPFNYDSNDLDLDYFCLAIERQLHEITTHTNPHPSDFVFSPMYIFVFNLGAAKLTTTTFRNQPFAPADWRSAADIVALGEEYVAPREESGVVPPSGIGSIRRTLLSSWKEVEVITRRPRIP